MTINQKKKLDECFARQRKIAEKMEKYRALVPLSNTSQRNGISDTE